MKVVFLCGGIGRRMSPITEDKFLLKFLGQTLLEHQIEQAREAGVTCFVIVANSTNLAKIKEVTGDINGVSFEFAVQRGPLGMADALASAEELLSAEPFLVVSSNDILDGSAYGDILGEYEGGSALSYILASRVESYFPGGYLVVNDQNELTGIVEKPRRGEEPSDLVNIVVHLHTKPKVLFENIASIVRDGDDVYERALQQMVELGYRAKVVAYNSFWAAIKYPWHIFTAMEYFLSRIGRNISESAQVSPTAIIEGDVVLGEEVKVLEHAVIRGPCYIGRNSVIGNNVLIRGESHIGEDCVVGYGTEVKHSYIGDNCWFHSCYVGDSIIADNCNFGAGTVMSNWRFDEGNIRIKIGDEIIDTGLDKLGAIIGSNCRTGVNASIMPGRRMGPNSVLGPNLCLTGDLGSDRVFLSGRSRKIRK